MLLVGFRGSAANGRKKIVLLEARASEADPESIVAMFDARARRFETPCGDGVMVWRVWGKGAPLVLGHGAQGAWSHWIRNIEALAAARMVIAPDLPGYGESAMPEAADHAAISKALALGLTQILGEDFAVDMAGFSFGGVAFAWFASFHRQMVRRLVLVGTGGLDTPMGHVDLRRVGGLKGEERRAAMKANLLGLMLHAPESVDELAMHLLVLNGKRSRLVPSPLVLPDRLLEVLPRVHAELGAIWGEFDRPHPNPPAQEAVLRRFHAELDFRTIAGAGHWAMYERPDAVNAALIDMLDAPIRTQRISSP
jgi:pimeloyl-ACP methyl ester carboxylesterase